MKGGRRTSKGRIINLDDLIASSPHTTAVGNMRVNAQGDELGKGGEVTKTREQRTRAYYKDHPQSSNRKVSLKGDMHDGFTPEATDFAGLKPDTANTGYENVRTEEIDDFDDPANFVESEPEAPEPDEFDDVEMPPAENMLDEHGQYIREPDGYREVEQENGDIEMQPYWNDEDES